MTKGALELLAVVALLALFLLCMSCEKKGWLDRYQDQMSELPSGTWTPAWEMSDAD